ncbi:MAG: hypothetical protein FWF80_01490, partial [Defluviitaleaceae bacterium]|nr:hypothetical protein [Defluviitaleaceae bacterium]
MRGSIMITGESDFALSLADIFTREGYEVFTPHTDKTAKLDFLADTTDYRKTPEDYEKTFSENVIKPMATLEKFLPFLDAGETRRLFYVTSAEASINNAQNSDNYAYKMSKAAL